jgi:2-keto-4-pentenoate hydratase/2-oxohepta-3-ene-1,7-dioic acid hydratase in catechol pathway
MRLVTFKTSDGKEHIGVLRDNKIVDLTLWSSTTDSAAHDHVDMVDHITQGEAGLQRAQAALDTPLDRLEAIGALIDLSDDKLLAPISHPRKNIMCLGRNYAEHVAESVRAFKEATPSEAKPEYPNIFTKATTTMNGPFGEIPYDADLTRELDWEIELALVIGKKGKNIAPEDAFDYIYGYMVLNDISARDIQKRHGNQNFKGKSLDGTCPTGPCIVTADEIPNPQDLRLTLKLNGVVKQDDRTSNMLFSIGEVVEHMSRGLTLEPGDIIATGTPAGVGMGRTPKEFLQPGDIIECEIEKIGVIRNKVVSI